MFSFDDAIRLHGREVVLRPLSEDDATALAAAAAGLRALHPVSFVPAGLDDARAYIGKALRERCGGTRYPFALLWQGALAGTTSYLDFAYWERPGVPPSFPAAVEIGATWLSRAAQRTRCNTEAKLLLLTHAFETWCVRRVSFRTDERNFGSRRAIERLGARFEGVRRAEMLGADGAIRDSAHYSIVAAEWPAIKLQLQSWLAGK